MANEWNNAITKPYERYAGKKANSNATMDTSVGPDMSRGTKYKSQKDVDIITSQATKPKAEATASEGSFKDAFKEARTGSKKSFTWKGKKYNTELAGEDKPKAKPAFTKLKDTSGDYYPADGISGDMGSASGEMGADMGKVNKGGYDPEEGMKRGGKVKPKCMARGGGCEVRGKTKGRMV